jgi:hypothetical protein
VKLGERIQAHRVKPSRQPRRSKRLASLLRRFGVAVSKLGER